MVTVTNEVKGCAIQLKLAGFGRSMVINMAFSKGKRIEDEMSKRIIALAVNIGCKEGAEALTVTRLCRALNCDRRVIYNRFRDINEINLMVAKRCNKELIEKAEAAVRADAPYYDNFLSRITTVFTCIYENNAHFQYYTTLYEMSKKGVENGLIQAFEQVIEDGKVQGKVNAATDSKKAAQNLWTIVTGNGRILAANADYPYQEAFDTMLYGVRAILEYMKSV